MKIEIDFHQYSRLLKLLFFGLTRKENPASPHASCAQAMIRPTLAALCGAALVCWRTRWRASLRRVGTVIVPRPAEFEAKLAALVRGGAGKLQVLADFDRTITTATVQGPDGAAKPGLSCHGVLEHCSCLSAGYRAAMQANYIKYRAVETDPLLSNAEKLPLMREWYGANHAALVREDLRRGDIAAAVREHVGTGGANVDADVALRDGVSEVVRALETARVPLLLFSAGLTDVLAEIMSQLYGQLAPSTHVVSNQMRWAETSVGGEGAAAGGERGPRLVGFSEPLLHMFNKDFTALRGTSFAAEIGAGRRPHVLLLGDGLGDAAMADGQSPLPAVVLRVGFLNTRIEQSLPQFAAAFDLLVLNDGPMDAVLDIVRAVVGGAEETSR